MNLFFNLIDNSEHYYNEPLSNAIRKVSGHSHQLIGGQLIGLGTDNPPPAHWWKIELSRKPFINFLKKSSILKRGPDAYDPFSI